jgi:EmrB/QacA subfamily drug resistance transporter
MAVMNAAASGESTAAPGRVESGLSESGGAEDGAGRTAWLTLFVVACGVIMVGLDGTVVAIANPAIGRSLHASLSDLQWITNSYLLVLAVLLIVGGKLGDRYGRRRVFLIGVTGFALSSVGVGVIGSVTGVIVLRAVQGLFGALLLPNTLGLLRAVFPADELNQAVGIWSASSATAIAGAPILGGFLVQSVSWQSVFFLNVPVAALTLAVGVVVLPESRESVRQGVDAPGLVALATTLFTLVYGVVQAQTWGWGSDKVWSLLAVSVVSGAAFVVAERRAAFPLVPLRLLRDRSIGLGIVTVALNFFALYGCLFFISLYLQNVHGDDPIAAGVRLLPLIGPFAMISPIAGRITTRFGPRPPITVGLAVVSLALLALVRLEPGSGYSVLWPSMVAMGVGIGLVIVASTEAIVANAPVDEAGLAGGLQGVAVQLGGVLGSSVLGSVVAARVASVLVAKLTVRGVPGATVRRVNIHHALVGQGLVPSGAAAGGRAAVISGSHAAFMSGLHVAFLLGAAATLLGAVAGLFIRRGDSEMVAVVHM